MERVNKPALMKRLFELGTQYSGQILSYNKMLGQLQDAGNTTTLARYLGLLSKAGLVTEIPKFSIAEHRRRAASPKLNVLNTALMTAYTGYSLDEAKADRSYWGRMVESAVGAHLFNTAQAPLRVYYWRENNFEVDFVLQRGAKLMAIEVKSGRRKSNVRGLEAFLQKFNTDSSLIVGPEGVPIEEFLSAPAAHWTENS